MTVRHDGTAGAAGSSGVAILLAALFAWTVSNLDQSLFGYAVPGILTEFQAGLPVIGGILSVSFAVAAIVVVFAGLAADRYGRRVTLVALLAGSAFCVGLHGFVGDINQLALARTVAFSLAAGIAPITAAYVAESSPARHRGMLMGVLQCGYPLGWFLAAVAAAPLLESKGWRSIFLVGFAMVPAALLIGWRLPESARYAAVAAQRRAGSAAVAGRSPLADLFGAHYRRRSIACLVLFFCFGCAYAGTAFYFPSFFVDVRHYTPAEAAWLVGLSNGIAVLGYLSAAAVGEYFWTRRNTYAVWCVLGALALLALMWLPTARWHDLALFALMGAFFYGSNAVVGALLTDLYPTSMRATAFAAVGSAPLALGFAVYPSIVPLVVGHLGWQLAFSVAIVPLLLASALAALWLPDLRSGEDIADT